MGGLSVFLRLALAIPLIIRLGVAYCASFVSRASFVEMSTVKSTLAFLWKWAWCYTRRFAQHASTGRPHAAPGTVAHAVFYAVCQGLFYIVCFKARAIAALGDDSGREFLRQWDWSGLLSSALRPLQFCLESVRLEFPKALRAVLPGFVLHVPRPEGAALTTAAFSLSSSSSSSSSFSSSSSSAAAAAASSAAAGPTSLSTVVHFAGVELGKGSSASVGAGGGGAGGGVEGGGGGGVAGGVGGTYANPLDSFFPFDPYALWESSQYVTPLYQAWEPIDEDDDDAAAPADGSSGAARSGSGGAHQSEHCFTTDEEDGDGGGAGVLSMEDDDDNDDDDGGGDDDDDDDDNDDDDDDDDGDDDRDAMCGGLRGARSMLQQFEDDDLGADGDEDGEQDEGVVHMEVQQHQVVRRRSSNTSDPSFSFSGMW